MKNLRLKIVRWWYIRKARQLWQSGDGYDCGRSLLSYISPRITESQRKARKLVKLAQLIDRKLVV